MFYLTLMNLEYMKVSPFEISYSNFIDIQIAWPIIFEDYCIIKY